MNGYALSPFPFQLFQPVLLSFPKTRCNVISFGLNILTYGRFSSSPTAPYLATLNSSLLLSMFPPPIARLNKFYHTKLSGRSVSAITY